ncbi:MAG: hypothetical protein DRP29_07545 [Thermodesulfobacteriota bacterium]|nr:MAG: hypothetical protein DRP29_07545 [Thermodesulfobacteriota bacterium]
MRKIKSFGIIILSTLLLIFPSSLYSKKGKGSQRFEGVGVGEEVSTEAKKLKEMEEKKFGEWVKEKARKKERIEMHKEKMKSKKELKKEKKHKRERKRYRKKFKKEGNFTE